MRCDQLEGEFREHQEMVQELLMQVARLQSKNVKGSAVPPDSESPRSEQCSVGIGREDQAEKKGSAPGAEHEKQ
jgi:hypothetical protein